jgi:hypothetical protein
VVDQSFLFGVPVEAGDGAQPAGHGGSGPAEGLQMSAEPFDVDPADTEQRDVSFGAPRRELAQVEPVGIEGQAAVASQEPGQGEFLGPVNSSRAQSMAMPTG